jgi:chromosome segregation ATPase
MFNKLKTMLGLIKFQANSKLVDGTEILIEGDLSEGTKVFVITEEGNIPLPDGTYELEDGKTIISVAEGLITDVSEKPEEPVEEVPTEAAEIPAETPEVEVEVAPATDVEAKLKELEDKLASLEEKVNSLSASSEEIKNQNEKLEKSNLDLSEDKQKLVEKVSEFEAKLSKIDGAEPAKKSNSNVGFNVPMDENTSKIMKAISSAKLKK